MIAWNVTLTIALDLRSTEKEKYLFLSVLSLASFLSCHWSPSSPKLGRSAHYTFMRHRSLLNVCMRVCLCEREYASMNTRKPRGDWNGHEIQNDTGNYACNGFRDPSKRPVCSIIRSIDPDNRVIRSMTNDRTAERQRVKNLILLIYRFIW